MDSEKGEKNFIKEDNITKMYQHLFIMRLIIKKIKEKNVHQQVLKRIEASARVIQDAIEKAIDNIWHYVEEHHESEERFYAFTINCDNCHKNYPRDLDGSILYMVEDMEGETYDEKLDLHEKLKSCPYKENIHPKSLCADFEPIDPLIGTHYPGFNLITTDEDPTGGNNEKTV